MSSVGTVQLSRLVEFILRSRNVGLPGAMCVDEVGGIGTDIDREAFDDRLAQKIHLEHISLRSFAMKYKYCTHICRHAQRNEERDD